MFIDKKYLFLLIGINVDLLYKTNYILNLKYLFRATLIFISLWEIIGCNSNTKPVPPAVITPAIPSYDHVVIVILENKSYENIIDSTAAPYIKSLANTYASFTQSFAIEHPSQPNYLDLYSGSNQGITTDDYLTTRFTTANLGKQLIGAGKTFITFSEDLPNAGYDGKIYNRYARKHNPAANWVGTDSNQISANTNQPSTAFPTDFTQLPTVSFVIPNLDNDMHDGSISKGDTWVKNNLDLYVTWAQTHNSLFILTFDEDDNSDNNHIATIFAGQHIKPGPYTSIINHYTVLRTIEDMYSLRYAGHAYEATSITYCWK